MRLQNISVQALAKLLADMEISWTAVSATPQESQETKRSPGRKAVSCKDASTDRKLVIAVSAKLQDSEGIGAESKPSESYNRPAYPK